MRKYIATAIVCLVAMVELAAQQHREFPALQINFKDGSSEIVTYPISGYRYGVDNPQPGDYIRCHMADTPAVATPYPGNLMPSYSLTGYGQEALAHCNGFGLVFSDAPIDTAQIDLQGTEALYTVLNGRIERHHLPFDAEAIDFYMEYAQELGKNYYLLAYYSLDGVMHYSEPLEQRIPKRISDVVARTPSNIYPLNDNAYVRLDYSSVSAKIKEHYGLKSSLSIDDVVSTMTRNHVSSLSEGQIKQMADSVDVCDDGNIYFLVLDTTFVPEIITFIDKEAATPFQVKAADAVELVLMPNDATKTVETEFVTDFATGYIPILVNCDASWGIADNQYLSTNVPNISKKGASLAIRINHIMMPGKAYQVTVSLAPETDEQSSDTLDVEFFMLMADGQDEDLANDTYPTHRKRQLLKNGRTDKYTIINPETEGCMFAAYAGKVTTYTFEYTPERLVYNHALKLMNSSAIISTTSGKGKNIRLISIDVTPATE